MLRLVRRRLTRSDTGETLIEIVMSIAIMGICILSIGSMMVLSVKISAVHRAQATASQFLHNYAESIQSAYQACTSSTTPDYVSSLVPPANFNPPTAVVKYWDGSAFGSSCPASDSGVQQVTLTLTSKDRTVSESLVTVVGKLS